MKTTAVAVAAFLAGVLVAMDLQGLEAKPVSPLVQGGPLAFLGEPYPALTARNLLQPMTEAQATRVCFRLQRGLLAAGWPKMLMPTMLAIARAESGCRQDAVLETFREHSLGPLQINVRAHPWVTPWCARDTICASRAALVIARRQGLRAWTAYRTGAYRRWFD